MKPITFAALMLVLLTTIVRADDPPKIQVQITYVDTSIVGTEVSKLLPAPTVTQGDAVAFFLRGLKKGYIRNKVTVGPQIVTENSVRAALDQTHTVSAASIGQKGADYRFGPRVTLTPTIVKNDLVSVVMSITDQESVGPDGYWLKKPETVNADSWPSFKAHSGSTIFLGATWGTHNIERFTFATVTILPPVK